MAASALANMSIGRLLFLSGLALLSACAQTKVDEGVLLSGDAPVAENAKYPDFSKPLTSAMDQMSDAEAAKMQADLDGLAQRRRAGTISEAEYRRRVAEMRRLKAEMPAKPAG